MIEITNISIKSVLQKKIIIALIEVYSILNSTPVFY